jgi:hypothetical protein
VIVRRAALAAVIAISACSKPAPKEPPKPAKSAAEATADAGSGPNHGKFASSIKAARESLEKTPCDKRQAQMLGDYLNRADDHKGAIAWVDAFDAKCEKWPRLWWVKQYACEQLEDWACASKVGTALIENNPHDSDFWWWRGRAEAHLGHHDQAKSDFLQSMANKPTGFPAFQLQTFAEEKLKRPCDGALLIQWWTEHGKRTQEDWIDPARTRLFLAGKCNKLAGKGKATIAAASNAPVVKVKVKLDGAQGNFLLDERAGHTAVTPTFAKKAKLTSGAERVVFMAGGSLKDGLLAGVKKVQVGNASAEELEVAVTEGLPDGYDGVLGLDVLMQFDVKRTPKAFELGPIAK